MACGSSLWDLLPDPVGWTDCDLGGLDLVVKHGICHGSSDRRSWKVSCVSLVFPDLLVLRFQSARQWDETVTPRARTLSLVLGWKFSCVGLLTPDTLKQHWKWGHCCTFLRMCWTWNTPFPESPSSSICQQVPHSEPALCQLHQQWEFSFELNALNSFFYINY